MMSNEVKATTGPAPLPAFGGARIELGDLNSLVITLAIPLDDCHEEIMGRGELHRTPVTYKIPLAGSHRQEVEVSVQIVSRGRNLEPKKE